MVIILQQTIDSLSTTIFFYSFLNLQRKSFVNIQKLFIIILFMIMCFTNKYNQFAFIHYWLCFIILI